MGKLTNFRLGHFQYLCNKVPEGNKQLDIAIKAAGFESFKSNRWGLTYSINIKGFSNSNSRVWC